MHKKNTESTQIMAEPQNKIFRCDLPFNFPVALPGQHRSQSTMIIPTASEENLQATSFKGSPDTKQTESRYGRDKMHGSV